jgi:hypothetical protein
MWILIPFFYKCGLDSNNSRNKTPNKTETKEIGSLIKSKIPSRIESQLNNELNSMLTTNHFELPFDDDTAFTIDSTLAVELPNNWTVFLVMGSFVPSGAPIHVTSCYNKVRDYVSLDIYSLPVDFITELTSCNVAENSIQVFGKHTDFSGDNDEVEILTIVEYPRTSPYE